VIHDLTVERLLDSTPEVAFDAFVDPEAQHELYADAPDWIVHSECDLRVGGRWTVTFGPPGREPARESNVFEEVDRPRRLAFTSAMRMPDGTEIDTHVRVSFDLRTGRRGSGSSSAASRARSSGTISRAAGGASSRGSSASSARVGR
jgi:uncharacterized protein YndB with AHSA1/START domain